MSKSITNQLKEVFQKSFVKVFSEEYKDLDPILKPSQRSQFGDFQANFAMSLAKSLKKKPRELADSIKNVLEEDSDLNKYFEKLEIAGPGFINIWLSSDFVIQNLNTQFDDSNLGVEKAKNPQNIVIDYGSPNVAKEMHVGHLRSTVIGDSLVRVLNFLGHNVIRQNHLGDWGTQFGMLIQNLIELGEDKSNSMQDLNAFYKEAKKRFDTDEAFAKAARDRVVLLQSKDPETYALWQKIVEQSAIYFNEIYQRLGVLLTPDDIKAESSYNNMLSQTVDQLVSSKLAETNQGAKVIFLDGFLDKEGNNVPFIIQKADGGYLYATTDLAAAKYRIENLNADRVIYVIDARQSQHLAMLFATINKTNWLANSNRDVKFDHVSFGMVLGGDRKPFKTRSGETIKLTYLIDEAISKAKAAMSEKKSDLSDETKLEVAQKLGIGALKYGDLCTDRVKDYVFDWDRLLSFEGNSAPYLLNAYVRVCSIFRKANIDMSVIKFSDSFIISSPFEKVLALKLLSFSQVINNFTKHLSPHNLCNYLCELAADFHRFYENCSILKADLDDIKSSRLALSKMSADVLSCGLGLLGIDVVDVM